MYYVPKFTELIFKKKKLFKANHDAQITGYIPGWVLSCIHFLPKN